MLIGIFGESCTGKSTLADAIAAETGAKIYSGKDYVKLAKNEAEAKTKFAELLRDNVEGGDTIIYVISEKEHMALLPEKAFRILAVADLDTIKERFSKRMNGNLPAPVGVMLEKKHHSFDGEKHDIRVDSTSDSAADICRKVLSIIKK